MDAQDKALPKLVGRVDSDISRGISDGSAFLLIRNWKSLAVGLAVLEATKTGCQVKVRHQFAFLCGFVMVRMISMNN